MIENQNEQKRKGQTLKTGKINKEKQVRRLKLWFAYWQNSDLGRKNKGLRVLSLSNRPCECALSLCETPHFVCVCYVLLCSMMTEMSTWANPQLLISVSSTLLHFPCLLKSPACCTPPVKHQIITTLMSINMPKTPLICSQSWIFLWALIWTLPLEYDQCILESTYQIQLMIFLLKSISPRGTTGGPSSKLVWWFEWEWPLYTHLFDYLVPS